MQNLYQPRKKRTHTSLIPVSIQPIAGSIVFLAASIRETSQKLERSSSAASATSPPGFLIAANTGLDTGLDRLGLPIPLSLMEHAVLVLNRMLKTAAITIKEYCEAFGILKENPSVVSFFPFGIPVMYKD